MPIDDQPELGRLGAAVTVGVLPEAEAGLRAIRVNCENERIAGVGTWRVLVQRRPETFVPFAAHGRDPEAPRHTVRQGTRQKFGRDSRAFQ